VLLSWEDEAYLSMKEAGGGAYQIVYPSRSILAEPPVAIVDRNVDRKKTRATAEAYLRFLYTPQAQEIVAKNYFRPRDPAVLAKYRSQFPTIALVHHRQGFRRLGQGAGHPFCQWRRVRPDLPAGPVT
jgi:ABC-type sulfate transport system substrate-binding protein